ncbi:4-(cytidine 5'-diphospho)-2-C-methyl-D-erythritol kinase [Ignavibacteria bacterium]|nr:4-(cytidine 5'-diphospho)-2-C-methyl-D-erythritol kinase [Bacteroidota bacterium]MCZ2132994.1 4-(cytidine 5'-diphospho)-2-C-methyl-D-erythritol kinase [Bacteroidota bacterium]
MFRSVRYAPAKINLGLEILGKRSDGFHEINTLFLPVTFCDILEVSENKELTLECSPSLGILPKDNIIMKAADALRRATGARSGAYIRLKKNIPQGAGLGGGSSDAATALQALNEIWQTCLSDDELREIAAQIGSDVPFFISKTAALGRGRGEHIELVEINLDYGIVIVQPNVAVSTAWAYNSALPATFCDKPSQFEEIIREIPAGEWRNYIFNDFEQGVFRRYPQIEVAKRLLYEAGAEFALMSGSGSCVFGLFADRERANSVANSFHNGYFCRQWTAEDLSEQNS